MDFRNQYRSMNEHTAPDNALVADTLARMARGEKPRHRPRRLRRVLTIAVAAAVAIGCMTPALAAMCRACTRRCIPFLPQSRNFSFR